MLEQYRNELVAFQEALGREFFLHYSGQKTSLDLKPIYDRYADLFTLDAIRSLRGQYEATDEFFSRQRRGIRLLTAFAEKHFVERQAQDLTEQIAAFEAGAKLQIGSEEIPFHRAVDILAKESDAQRRRVVTKQRLRLINESNDLRQERLFKLHESSRRLGYETYWAMVSAWRGNKLSVTADQFAEFLQQTESLYIGHLEQTLRQTVGITPAQADRADVAYFLQLNQFADVFPDDGVLPVYRETLRDLGIWEHRQQSVEIDDVRRPGKHPRSFCIPIKVPEEIKLSISRRGGPSDYHTMLHEGGHAQQYAWTAATLQAEFKVAGDPAVSEGYAFLFQSLMLEPMWLEEMMHFTKSAAFIQLGWLHKLFYLRRDSAKVGYEQVLHTTGDLTEASRQYAQRLTEATGFAFVAEEFLFDTDDYVYAANYLRAWLFEVQLREYLKTRFGKRWWRSAKAADFLIELWNAGQEYEAQELAFQAGLGPFSLDHLIIEFNDALK
jgi:hypothetical protein